MSRLKTRFADLAAGGRKAVVPYIVVGDPLPDATVDLMHALVDAGADVIELGVPFSDPMAEGPVIQRAHERSLEHGLRLRHAIDTVRDFRERDVATPVLLMGYANPVEHMGYDVFADRAAAAGVDALLTVDIPPEEVARVKAELTRVGMDNIFLVAPTTPPERRRRIAAEASGFLYYVSLKGVTGAASLDRGDVTRQVEELRQYCDLPVCVGFGIKDGASAAAIARNADGVVVGSALVQRLADVVEAGGDRRAVLDAARELIGDIRRSVDALEREAA